MSHDFYPQGDGKGKSFAYN